MSKSAYSFNTEFSGTMAMVVNNKINKILFFSFLGYFEPNSEPCISPILHRHETPLMFKESSAKHVKSNKNSLKNQNQVVKIDSTPLTLCLKFDAQSNGLKLKTCDSKQSGKATSSLGAKSNDVCPICNSNTCTFKSKTATKKNKKVDLKKNEKKMVNNSNKSDIVKIPIDIWELLQIICNPKETSSDASNDSGYCSFCEAPICTFAKKQNTSKDTSKNSAKNNKSNIQGTSTKSRMATLIIDKSEICSISNPSKKENISKGSKEKEGNSKVSEYCSFCDAHICKFKRKSKS